MSSVSSLDELYPFYPVQKQIFEKRLPGNVQADGLSHQPMQSKLVFQHHNDILTILGQAAPSNHEDF